MDTRVLYLHVGWVSAVTKVLGQCQLMTLKVKTHVPGLWDSNPLLIIFIFYIFYQFNKLITALHLLGMLSNTSYLWRELCEIIRLQFDILFGNCAIIRPHGWNKDKFTSVGEDIITFKDPSTHTNYLYVYIYVFKYWPKRSVYGQWPIRILSCFTIFFYQELCR